jgi:hypothetical protein
MTINQMEYLVKLEKNMTLLVKMVNGILVK